MKKILNNIISKLIVINVSYGILDIFLSSFLISYIMQSFSNQIIGVAIFYIFWSLMVWIGFVTAGDFTKRRNKMNVFRVSIILRIVACVILGLCDLNMSIVIMVASIMGLADGAMNLPWHNIISEKLSKSQLIKYTGYRQSVSYLVKVTLPVILGALLTASSYSIMVWMVIPFSILSFIVSFAVHSASSSNEPVALRKYARQCRKCKFTRRLLLTEFLRGLSFDRISIITTMLIVYYMHTDFALGWIKSLQSLCVIMAAAVMGRFLTPAWMPRLISYTTVGIVLASLIFLFVPTTPVLIAYLLIYIVAEKIFFQLLEMNVTNASNYNRLNRCNKIEYFVVRESALCTGRILNQLVLLAIGLLGGGVNQIIIMLIIMVLMTVPIAKLSISVCHSINARK